MAKNSTVNSEISHPLERLARLMRAGEHDGGLNPAQWEALRFLSRANRFSNSPIGLTRFLGSTKGTISQTVKALERKGHLAKLPRAGEKRSISLMLTDKGRQTLRDDPLTALSASLEELGNKTRRRLARGLQELLSLELVRREQKSFGTCNTCRYFREDGSGNEVNGPHSCMLFKEVLSDAEVQLICVEHS